MISDNEQTEIFDFYSATFYNLDVHVLDEGFWLVIETDLTKTGL